MIVRPPRGAADAERRGALPPRTFRRFSFSLAFSRSSLAYSAWLATLRLPSLLCLAPSKA